MNLQQGTQAVTVCDTRARLQGYNVERLPDLNTAHGRKHAEESELVTQEIA